MGTANWVNRAIVTGDNLDILRKMNSESVDLIYLDPPFNSNRTYEAPIGSEAAGAKFKDTWTLSDLDVAWMGLIADTEPALYRVVETAGLAHGKGMQSYLCMMAVRLTELRRVLKPTGSIYLHCDPTASHYLKTLMDVIYGQLNFKNEIVWCYTGPGNVRRKFKTKHDVLLFYGKDDPSSYFDRDAVRIPYDPETLARRGRVEGISTTIPINNHQIGKRSKAEVLAQFGNGKIPEDWWTGIGILTNQRERVGYPTQKPLALLERVLLASCPPGGVVLDPFCGCATACVAAEMHGRDWIGIDLSGKAVELVIKRVKDYQGLFQDIRHYSGVEDFPDRNDVLGVKQSYREMKHILFGEQEGFCKLCGQDFPFRMFEIDHVIPKSKGGGGSYRESPVALSAM